MIDNYLYRCIYKYKNIINIYREMSNIYVFVYTFLNVCVFIYAHKDTCIFIPRNIYGLGITDNFWE